MTQRQDRIRVQIEGQEFSVVGGSFQEMLAAIKQINGRRFSGELKVWQLPGSIAEIQRQLDLSGYRLEGGQPVAGTPVSSPPPRPRPGGDRIRVLVAGHPLAVVGGGFQEMLAVVKNLPGRRFDPESKVWEIPGEVGVVKGMIEAAGFQLEGADKLSLGPVPPMAPPDFLVKAGPPPPPFEPPDFSEDETDFPYEPPDWWDEGPPP